VGNAAIISDPYDADKFTERMYELLTDEELRKDIIKKGFQRSKIFKWEDSAQKTLKVYKEL
jgi:glycosyltransferase involved in cell wall biosynthesis